MNPQTEQKIKKDIEKSKRWRIYWLLLNAIPPVFGLIFLPYYFLITKIALVFAFTISYLYLLNSENNRIYFFCK